MSAGVPCPDRAAHMGFWRVAMRKYNVSAFNGHWATPSDYSSVVCTAPGCIASWRTKARYVDRLPDLSPDGEAGR